jgi:hypothetical protein
MMEGTRNLGAVLGIALTLCGGSLASQPAPPSCRTTLDQLEAKVEADYAGYLLEVRGQRRTAYDSALTNLRALAAGADDAACLDLLQTYIAWFDDPHLFLFQSAKLDSVESRRRMAGVALRPFDSLAYESQLRRPDDARDPIEGIWTDGRLRVAVTPDGDPRAGRFVAMVLTADTIAWPRNAVRARFLRIGTGRYRADLDLPNFAHRRLEADIYRNDLLRTSPGIWGREAPTAELTPGQLDPVDPRRPTLRIHDGTVIVAIPSHDPAYQRVLDSLVARNAETLRTADRLIIDLRGNEGGSVSTSNALIPYVVTDGQTAPALIDQAAARMLSSPDQIAYARQAFGPDTSAFVRSLVKRMEAAPGALVPLFDPGAPPKDDGLPPAILGPRRVGVVIDRGTVSAAEVIALYARMSKRVTIYGEPTAGALDYQSISIVPIAPDERRWYLGYPTVTRNETLPVGGMRGKGIAPDVRMDLAHLRDPIGWVEDDLRRR